MVDEAKNKNVVSTTPPISPRTSRSSRIQLHSASSRQEVSDDGTLLLNENKMKLSVVAHRNQERTILLFGRNLLVVTNLTSRQAIVFIE